MEIHNKAGQNTKMYSMEIYSVLPLAYFLVLFSSHPLKNESVLCTEKVSAQTGAKLMQGILLFIYLISLLP